MMIVLICILGHLYRVDYTAKALKAGGRDIAQYLKVSRMYVCMYYLEMHINVFFYCLKYTVCIVIYCVFILYINRKKVLN